jgi:hypothetical protein
MQRTAAYTWLKNSHIDGLQPLGALLDGELDPLVLAQRAEAFSLDGCVMDEDVLSSLACDEAIPLAVVEPLDGSDFFL